MLLFATGDGGFRGKDKELFEELASFGYPVAGFSARNYLRNLGYVAGTTTPQKLAWDYQRLIAFSERELALPANMPVVLVGNSRGAGLSVVAAGQRLVRREISGVLAIALTGEEEYVRHYRLRRGQLPPGTPRRELVTLQTYEYLPRLSSARASCMPSSRGATASWGRATRCTPRRGKACSGSARSSCRPGPPAAQNRAASSHGCGRTMTRICRVRSSG
jgi:hypothetical protein